jgi:class 3 adenylate cyclase
VTRRLRAADRVLLLLVFAIWAAGFALHVERLTTGRIGWVPAAFASAQAGEPPRVLEVWPQAASASGALRAGDRVLSVGGSDVRGSTRESLIGRLFAEADGELRVALRVERAGAEQEAALKLEPVPLPWRTAALSLAFAAIGVLAFRRARGSPAARSFFLASLAYAMSWHAFPGDGALHNVFALATLMVAPALAGPECARVLLLFPEEAASESRAAQLLPWLFVLNGPALTSWVFGTPWLPSVGQPLAMAGNVALIVTLLALLARGYLRSGAFGRRQLRWALLGFYLGLSGPLLAGGVAVLFPRLWWLYHVSLCAVVAIPLCLFVAFHRDHLFDVDRLISAAASYSLLIGVAFAGLLAAAPAASAALSQVASLDPETSQVLLAVAVTPLIGGAQRVVRPRLERVLFPERRALEHGAGRLRAELARCEKPADVLALLGARLDELLRPDGIAIYCRAGDVYAPVHARGAAIAPSLGSGGPIVELLGQTGDAIDLARWRGRPGAAPAARAERAVLEGMGAQLLVPLMPAEELIAFVCLGQKESGDIYTETDRALLQGLADLASTELRRFDDVESRRQEREMMEKLRRFVPGAIAEELASGGSLEEGEREVSVLFVDLRGYTSFSERRAAPEIFESVNRYTRTVSDVVLRHGGVVVEFNGDGMMAVFGAPRPLPRKEEAALRAARDLVSEVGQLEIEGTRLSVGVGVASGPAFVGSVRAVDRQIWSALGNTTNLAARLEKLTRDLDASIAVDAATWSASLPFGEGFEARPAQRIRGRSEPVDVYVLRLPPD